MTKGESNVEINCALDRLSELPDSLIFDIFHFLPVTDVVRTTILSKRWKDLWTTFPYLDFSDSQMMIGTDKIRNFVDGVVNSWRGIKVLKFIVDFCGYQGFELSDSWVRFATERDVEELELFVRLKFVVPQCVYSCSSLKSLWLTNCELRNDANVQWYRLKTLFICGEGFTENSINQVMCGSPRLEDFFFMFYNVSENLSIRSSSLRSLTINVRDRDARVIAPELRIWTPNLETLSIGGIPNSKCLLMNVSSLHITSLKIDSPHIMFPGTDFVGGRLSGILPSIKHVHGVTLSNWCIKALGAMKEKHMLSPFPNTVFLELIVCSDGYEDAVCVLEMFPELRKLVLQTTYESRVPKHAESSLEFARNLPNLFLLHLRTIDVTWTIGDNSMFPLVQFLLKTARNLEMMMVFLRDNGNGDESPASWKSLASQKLLQMERSSPTAKLIFS